MFIEGLGVKSCACLCLVMEWSALLVLFKPLTLPSEVPWTVSRPMKEIIRHQDTVWVLECQYAQQSPVVCFPRSYLN